MKHSPDQLSTQVAIVGAGPTGLSLAAQLLRFGIDFVLLDKKDGPTPLSKALVVQARSLEIFEELGLAAKAIGEGRTTMGLNMYARGSKRAFLDLNGLGKGKTPFPFVLSLEQSQTEQLLADYLQEQGKSIRWNAELLQMNPEESGVTLRYRDGHGQEHRLTAAYLVACDGAGSPVRHQLGLPFSGSTEPKLFYVADVRMSSPVICRDELYLYLVRKGFVLFFPMEGAGHYRIVGVLPEAGEEQWTFEQLDQQLKKDIVSPVQFEELRWFSTYKVHSRMAGAFQQGRCFLAGDAAHIHTPAGGQGMNTGIQDAYNLAWKLAFVLRGTVNEDVLATYGTERSQNARRLLRSTDRMFDIMAGSNRLWDFLRLRFFPLLFRWVTGQAFFRRRIFPFLSQTGIAYPDSGLTLKSSIGTVKAGDRMPFFVFSDGTSVFSYLAQPAFKLLFFGPPENDAFTTPGKIEPERYRFQEIPKGLFGDAQNFYVLLRPDNHISYIGPDPEQVRGFFRKIAPG
ncbi:FAD-dependent monooxygenase [Paraflavisolibacter sp. H34]|uniref:FAD-dependent monooxygenase n=1 Tax=Huijunlia imazamoxiresistens TaxID=3127457 RepID=UPI0030163787